MLNVPEPVTGCPWLLLWGAFGVNRNDALSAVFAFSAPSHVNTRTISHGRSVSLRCSMIHASKALPMTVSFSKLITQARA